MTDLQRVDERSWMFAVFNFQIGLFLIYFDCKSTTYTKIYVAEHIAKSPQCIYIFSFTSKLRTSTLWLRSLLWIPLFVEDLEELIFNNWTDFFFPNPKWVMMLLEKRHTINMYIFIVVLWDCFHDIKVM